MAASGFTESVRQELASRPLGTDREVAAELAALCRFAGILTVTGGGGAMRLVLASSSGAVARRVFSLLQHRYGIRAELAVRAPAGVQRRSRYEVRVADARPLIRDLGLIDGDGHLRHSVPDDLGDVEEPAYLRGAVLAAASFSAPGRPAHLEIATGSASVAVGLSQLLNARLSAKTTVTADARDRVVCKSGSAIGDLLVLVGAPGAFMQWDERRFRHQLRNEANRLANADAANVNRTIEAASAQVQAVEAALDRLGLETLDDDLRDVALARLANPAASLVEIGELLNPPVGKSTVHRRLARILAMADERTPER